MDRSGRESVTPAILWLIERIAGHHDLFVYVLRYHDRACTYPVDRMKRLVSSARW